MDMDRAELARLGHEMMNLIGYDEIIHLARKAGYVELKESASSAGGLVLAQSAAAAATDAVEVFSKYAVAAGVASQVDSPLPGPGDAVAVGIIVAGLINAGLLTEILARAHRNVQAPATSTPAPAAGSTTATPPAPSSAPTGHQTDVDPPPPLVVKPKPPVDCPRNESFTPERTDNSTGCIDKKGNVRCYTRRHDPCAGVHTHGKLRYQEIRNGICKSIEKDAVRCEGAFVISGPCGSVPTVECRTGGPEISGIYVQ